MLEYRKAKIRTIANNYVVVKCPACNRENKIVRCHTSDGVYFSDCKACDTRFKYVVDREDMYRGGDVGGKG